MPPRRRARCAPAGYTLIELVIAVTLLGLLAVVAVPAFDNAVQTARARAVLERFVGDLFLARMTAVRSGQRAELRFEWDEREECVRAYELLGRAGPDSLWLRRESGAGGVCLAMNNREDVVFDARGLPASFVARSLWVRVGPRADSLRVSQLGRVVRRY